MSKEQNPKKNNYIAKINIENNKLNKINHLVTKRNKNSKIININKIFIKNKNNLKKSSETIITKQGIHKKMNSNIEDYNNLVKLNISNKLNNLSLNKITKTPIHRRMLTERKVCKINNIKKRNGNRFVLINTRNKKMGDDHRLITEYFYRDNNEKTKDFISQNITRKNISDIDSDFNKLITEAGNKLILKTLKKKEFKKNSENFLKNTDTPNKKRFIKNLKANNFYNHSLDNTYSNLKLKKKEFINTNHLESFDFPEITKFFSNNNPNFNMTNYGFSLDIKEQITFRNHYKNERKKILKNNFFYKSILAEKTSFKTGDNYNLNKYFPKIMNNLTIDKILKETKKKDLSKIKYKKIKIKNKNINDINSNVKDKLYLTTQNSFKNLMSPKNITKINIKNRFDFKNTNFWKLKINLDKNSKLKIAKYLKQKQHTNLNWAKKSEPENKLNIKIKNIFSLTKKGFWQPGIEKTNQDNYFILNNINSEANSYFIGVCDGHGKYGKEISSFISLNLPNNLKKNIQDYKLNITKESLSNISEIITKTFIETNTSLSLNSNIDISSSGSTCSSIILTLNKIISVNLGDSRCVLGKYNKENNDWSYINLTRDHKPKEEDEKERILKKGGKISKDKDEFGNYLGITRIWQKEEGNIGLALTRSFGDEILSKVGVICEPEIKEFKLGKDDKFIILGTDGLWEYISSEECVNNVKDFYEKNDIQGATNFFFLYKEASKRWIMEQDVVDDITIILIYLN